MASFCCFPKFAVASLALGVCLSAGNSSAAAAGTVSIRQYDGHTDVYNNVLVKVIHDVLYLTSPDGKGTLIIRRAACAFQGALLVCLPNSAVLVQAGQTSVLQLRNGTLYVNLTSAAQPLPLSTAKVPAGGILLSFTTKHGTYVSLSGRIDKMVK